MLNIFSLFNSVSYRLGNLADTRTKLRASLDRSNHFSDDYNAKLVLPPTSCCKTIGLWAPAHANTAVRQLRAARFEFSVDTICISTLGRRAELYKCYRMIEEPSFAISIRKISR